MFEGLSPGSTQHAGTVSLHPDLRCCCLRHHARELCLARRFVQFMKDRKLTPQPHVESESAGPVYVVLQNEVETPGGMPHIAELPTAVTAMQVSSVVRRMFCCSTRP